jgi:hypothetical protein
MLLDSGADVTLVPELAVSRLGSSIMTDKQYELSSFDGSKSLAPMVQVELIFCQRTFRGQFLLINQAWGILGRNILNLVPLLFNGPRLEWVEYQPQNEGVTS